jgi:hypothetical protein
MLHNLQFGTSNYFPTETIFIFFRGTKNYFMEKKNFNQYYLLLLFSFSALINDMLLIKNKIKIKKLNFTFPKKKVSMYLLASFYHSYLHLELEKIVKA